MEISAEKISKNVLLGFFQIPFAIIGLCFGFAGSWFALLPFAVFNFRWPLAVFLVLFALVTFWVHKSNFASKKYFVVFLGAITIGILLQIIFSLLGGWELFSSSRDTMMGP